MNSKIDENNMIFECEAHDLEGLRICVAPFYKEDDTEVYLYSTTCNFDNLQRKWYHRIVLAFKILFGREFYFHQIALNKKDIEAMIKFLSGIKFKDDKNNKEG